jgi:hypothetical protein
MEFEFTSSLKELELSPTTSDLFWKEKISRAIKEECSISTVKEYAELLLQLATQRQGCIRGLVKELLATKNIKIPDSELDNPEIKSQET